MSAAGNTAIPGNEARKAWASALRTLLLEGAWLDGAARPADLDGWIKVFARRLKVSAEALKAPDRAVVPGAPEKAIATWLDGTVPYAKAFGALGLALFGDDFEKHEGYQRLRAIWLAAGKSPKGSLLDTTPPAAPARLGSAAAGNAAASPDRGSTLSGFISYAHEDIALLRQLRMDLATTERSLPVAFWCDPDIKAGQRWRIELQQRIDAADVFLLLASRPYLASEFIHRHELPAIRDRLLVQGTLAITVILAPCGWKRTLGDHLQAVPTYDGHDKPISQWPDADAAFNRAREEIEESLEFHFRLARHVHADEPNVLKALGQEPAGIPWWQRDDRFVQDLDRDARTAADPNVKGMQAHVAEAAGKFAVTAARPDNFPGWGGIRHAARNLADAIKLPPEQVPAQIGTIYPAIAALASFLEQQEALRSGVDSDIDPLAPEIERDLRHVVDMASIWIRQFARASLLDDAWREAKGLRHATADAAAIMHGARTHRIVPEADATRTLGLLEPEQPGVAGQVKALYGTAGVRNLIYRGGALVSEQKRARGSARSPLARRTRDFLGEQAPPIRQLFSDRPPHVRRAVDRLLAEEAGPDTAPGGGTEEASNTASSRRVTAQEFWGEERGPTWADDWGIDAHGRWVTFSVPAADGTSVVQRMRGIPHGRFMIGSPDGEAGRYDDEGPQQEVTIADDFWMFDTACTEALWAAVTGKTPDPCRGSAFPVTNVSWQDAQGFIRRINDAKPGLELSLPSEARWEYACRAGTDTPYHFGARISHDLACYETDAPVPTCGLPPNGWGLYEMHGNVWEWCADHWHENYRGVPQNGSAWLVKRGAANRVVRGGAWNGVARLVRAALRNHVVPAFRRDFLGFRCARVQSAGEERLAERRAGRSKPGERSETAATISAAVEHPDPTNELSAADPEDAVSERLAYRRLLDQKQDQIISALARHIGTTFVRRRGVYFWDAKHNKRVICTISKQHRRRHQPYWFGYHREWHNFLIGQGDGHLVLGCMGLTFAFAIPVTAIASILAKLNTTPPEGPAKYWHLRIVEQSPGSYALAVPNSEAFSLDRYRLPLE